VTSYSGLIESLVEKNSSRIVYFIMDGLGGLPMGEHSETELFAADTPHLDALARRSECGFILPVAPGVTPGSGPAHFALFGYDPVEAHIGRGVLEAAGIEFNLTARDLAARGNFATVDDQGHVVDRRAGRLNTEENRRICAKLKEKVAVPGIELFIEPVKEHRVLVVFRGEGLRGDIADTDPQGVGAPPLQPVATDPGSEKASRVVKEFLNQASRVLADEKQANFLTLRGFAKHEPYASMEQRFGLRSLCIANYPMYRGVCSLLGMTLHPAEEDGGPQIKALKQNFQSFDFFFLHFKSPDKTGEDGDFTAKVKAIEELDRLIPAVLDLQPEVLVVTGDHSTPSAMKSHSWHPVPVLLHAEFVRKSPLSAFNETECLKGTLGRIPSHQLLPLALAYAGRLRKFGA
jgi:2,3-bisphosphoglycerate-independent phosphoglycerate mutase